MKSLWKLKLQFFISCIAAIVSCVFICSFVFSAQQLGAKKSFQKQATHVSVDPFASELEEEDNESVSQKLFLYVLTVFFDNNFELATRPAPKAEVSSWKSVISHIYQPRTFCFQTAPPSANV